ncbi:hypothetical protein [Sulfurospirillum halorespirans]|uniref:Uncharacterized protein n=1 Tax=Sulfurospirillum halorespirans DSM 13726 TaxID=1193502 RepID=A0A1D7TG25_9BACT|nr:hypothetical protein [Sulfurospirillum halorespirans]AOO63824.1 hypothetical protein SHALO_0021 [Sulfurospirillum halorespirans DSM 13726]
MKYSSFLYKEINYTKLGKRIARKTWNGYQQLLKSLKHSLRLQKEDKIHIDKEKTKNNFYYSCFEFSTQDDLIGKIEKDIEEKIQKFENITDENERKKQFKDFQNAKYAISKKIPLDILELELKESDDAGTVLHNVVYKHKIKNLKSKDKRTLKTLEHYISMSKSYFSTKQKTRKYNNQTLMKELLFKIPEGQELTLTNEEWNVIIHNFKSLYFKNYDLYCYAIHGDEGTEDKSHVHLFLSSYNKDANDFDIQKNLFEFISKKHDLRLDINKNDDHKIFMQHFQDDFFSFFNEQLHSLKKKERIKQNEYLNNEDIKKRLLIQNDDKLTIDQRHTKLINQKLLERIQEVKDPIKILKFETSEKSSIFSSDITQKIEIEAESKDDIKKVIKAIKNYSNLSNFIQDLEQKNREKDIKIFSLNQKLNDDYFFFNKKENDLLEQIDILKNDKNEDKNKIKMDLIKSTETNKILKSILQKITNVEINEIDQNLEFNILEHIKKMQKIKDLEKEKLDNARLTNKKKTEEHEEVKNKIV